MTPSKAAAGAREDVLIITNGDSAVARLEQAGVAGAILPWRDVLHDGPVPDTGGLERLSAIRANFIAADLGLSADEVAGEFRERDAAIRQHSGFARVEIWLEHDLYDQLQLLQILDVFRSEQRLDGLFLVQAEDYLGIQDPAGMRDLVETATPVTGAHQRLASDVWSAFTAPTPHALADIARTDTSDLPHLAKAIERLLAELPDPLRGLTLTEERALSHLEQEEITSGELFRRVTAEDEAQFLGDASFFRRLDGLAFSQSPLITGLPSTSRSMTGRPADRGYAEFARARLKLTHTGRAVLSGRVDHRVLNVADHWVGGTHVSPAAFIRYDRAESRLVAQS